MNTQEVEFEAFLGRDGVDWYWEIKIGERLFYNHVPYDSEEAALEAANAYYVKNPYGKF